METLVVHSSVIMLDLYNYSPWNNKDIMLIRFNKTVSIQQVAKNKIFTQLINEGLGLKA